MLQTLKDLEHEVGSFAEQLEAPGLRLLGPKRVYGIEINPFARELARTVVWIGYLQWNRANGITKGQEPILEALSNFVLHDALINEDSGEYERPEADFIIGKPPFIGGKRMHSELGDAYVDTIFITFDGSVARETDFVTYWFERARAQIASGSSRRGGLIATNSIRGGANRRVVERIKDTGDISFAWSDEPWVLDGAAVRVSIIGFGNGTEREVELYGSLVAEVQANLTALPDITRSKRLAENLRTSFMGTTKGGSFDIPEGLAMVWLDSPNPSGRSNREVVKPWGNGTDVTRRSRGMWIIDFAEMDEAEASQFVAPFGYAREVVKPKRLAGRDQPRQTLLVAPLEAAAGLKGGAGSTTALHLHAACGAPQAVRLAWGRRCSGLGNDRVHEGRRLLFRCPPLSHSRGLVVGPRY